MCPGERSKPGVHVGTAIVTGSASGIGHEVRGLLEGQGDRVVGVDLREAEVVADLASAEGRRFAVAQSLEVAGGQVDRVVVGAGVGAHVRDGARVAMVNFFGAVELLDGLRPSMEGRPEAAAVAICSNAAQREGYSESPIVDALLDGDVELAARRIGAADGVATYGLSKHALSRAVRRRAAAWGRAGVRLNGIAPGPTDTPLLMGTREDDALAPALAAMPIPLGRWATPNEVAGVVGFMLSEAAAYLHGSILWMDGGTDAVRRPDDF